MLAFTFGDAGDLASMQIDRQASGLAQRSTIGLDPGGLTASGKPSVRYDHVDTLACRCQGTLGQSGSAAG
jgi:hypothetical protein